MSVAVQPSTSGSVVATDKGKETTTDDAQLPELRSSQMALDLRKPLPTSLQSDFLPEDVLLALTQPPPARDTLGPPSRFRNLETSNAQTRQRPANVWSFKRRDKFQHLTQNPPCACGAGKDISFLYDVPQKTEPQPRPDKIDRSQVRKDASGEEKKKINLPDTLIPEEYHIIRNKGVLGIEYFEDKYSIQPEDHDKHLVTFPSLRPSKRAEVLQLRQTLHDMLEKAGVNDVEVEVRGPTQMHNLLELIKKEQNIYNVVFHEVIRQVSVECTERGELLAELRHRYSDLLSKIPHQIKSLHEEVMAQRALDRRLTEELMRFKTTISVLTNELTDVKEHDRKVTKEAHQAQENLKAALAEAQKNASLLAEYHDLYELQRKRLERSVFMLSDEKEIWSTAAYSLALKVTEESRLTTAKRLHLSEKAWAKLANHFTILLSDRDTEVLASVQASVEKWRDLTEDFHFLLRRREDEMREELASVKSGILSTVDDFRRACYNDEGQLMKAPDTERAKGYLSALQQWNQHLNSISELFGGDVLLSGQESLRQIQMQMEAWTDAAIKVFGRHRGLDGKQHAEQDRMMSLNEEIEQLLKQLQTRITGENGVAGGVINLSNSLETWEAKLRASLCQQVALKESDWGVLMLALEEWAAAVDSVTWCVGSVQPEELRDANPQPRVKRIEVQDCVKKTQKWVTTASNSVDSEDAKMMEMVSTLHSEMVQWMVQMLLRLAPDMEGNSAEASELALLGSCSVAQLLQNAKSLFERLTKFSFYIRACCDSIVTENTQKRMENMEDNADHEMKELGRLQRECDQWVRTAKLLLVTLTGETMDELFPAPLPSAMVPESAPTPHPEPVFYDHEKLQPQGETTEAPVTQGTETPAPRTATPPAGKATPAADVTAAEEVRPDTAPAQAEEEEKKDEDEEAEEKEAEESADAEVREVTDQEDKKVTPETFERIGDDDNTHRATMEVTSSTPPPPDQGPPTAARTAGLDTQQAFQALAAVESLQNQLLATEERAQTAEEKVVELETELMTQRETIRALERKLAQLEAPAQRSEAVTPTRKASTTPASMTSTISPAPTTSQTDVKRSSSRSKKKTGRKD